MVIGRLLSAGWGPFPKILLSDEDVHLQRQDGRTVRYGYFTGRTFFRENPLPRSMKLHAGAYPREGIVEQITEVKGRGAEPQYDMVIQFDFNGNIAYVNDKRTVQELEAYDAE
jgi:hypothetical protein